MYSGSVILILLIFAFIFAISVLIAGKIFATRVPENDDKLSAYECGISSEFDTKKNITPRYYTFAILFIVYNAEILLLFPFAVAFGKLHSFVFLQAIIFILVLILSLSYAMRKNLLRFR